MRMLMSWTPARPRGPGAARAGPCTTPRIWLSALPCGSPAGRLTSRWVWKNSLPPASRWPVASAAALGHAGRRRAWPPGVQVAADLAGVARHLGHALLVAVQFLQRDHRQVDVVLFEAEQRGRVVHQHVGVEHEQAGRPAAARRARHAAPAPPRRAGRAAGLRRWGGRPPARRRGAAVGTGPSPRARRVRRRCGSGAVAFAGLGAAACDSKSAGRMAARLAGGLGSGMEAVSAA